MTGTRHLDSQPSSTENTFYPAIKNLISAVLKERRLPFEIRVNTPEAKGKARDMLNFILCDDKMFVGVYGEVKRTNVTLEDLAVSTERNDQIGRYLAQTASFFSRMFAALGYSPAFRAMSAQRAVPFRPRSPIIPAIRLWAPVGYEDVSDAQRLNG